MVLSFCFLSVKIKFKNKTSLDKMKYDWLLKFKLTISLSKMLKSQNTNKLSMYKF